MEASFNDTLFNFRLIGLNWSVTVVFFFHSFMSHTVRTKYLKGGGHKLILSYYPGREISRVELVQLKKSWEILNCLIILLRGLFHSLSLSHFPSLIHSAHSTHPTQFIAIYYAHSTPLTAPHSVFYHSFRSFHSFHSSHSTSLSILSLIPLILLISSSHFHSLSSFSFIPLIPLILIHSVHFTHSAHLISLYLVYSHSFRFIFTRTARFHSFPSFSFIKVHYFHSYILIFIHFTHSYSIR